MSNFKLVKRSGEQIDILPYSRKLNTAMERLLNSIAMERLSQCEGLGNYVKVNNDYDFVTDVLKFAQDKGFITIKQARIIGGKYNTYVNGGEYVRNDWW